MNQPGHIDDLPLGRVAGIPVKAKLSDKSAVTWLKRETVFLVEHLVIVCEEEGTTWPDARSKGLRRGDLTSLAEDKKAALVHHFLPGLEPEEAECRYEVNSDGAGSRPTVHTHVIIGHKSLFGDDGKIRRIIDDIRKPKLIIDWFLKRAGGWTEALGSALEEVFPAKKSASK